MAGDIEPQHVIATGRTRREALRAGGALALAAMGAAIAGPAVFAQSASPGPAAGALTGRYVVVRFRQFLPDQDVAAAQQTIATGFVPLNQAIPGFVSYFGSADPVTGAAVYVGVFEDKAGADESNRVAADWLTSNGYAFFTGEPTVYEGIIDYDVAAAG